MAEFLGLGMTHYPPFAGTDENMAGVYVVTSPGPVTNDQFMRTLRRAMHRPWSPPVPKPMLYLGAIEGSEEHSPALNVYCESMLSWLEGVTSLEGFQSGAERDA